MTKFLLQENGDFLLQENGDKIIIDTSYLISGIASLLGAPVTGAKITLLKSSDDTVVDTMMTDSDGYYEFLNLDPLELYHAVAELDDTPDLYNAKSLPFLEPTR